MLFFIREVNHDLFRYTWDAIESDYEIVTLPTIRKRKLLKLCHFLWILHIYPRLMLYEDSVYRKLSRVKADDIVIFSCNPRVICSLVPFVSRKCSRVWFWDTISSMPDWKALMNCLLGLKIPLGTFDPDDAFRYRMKFIPSFYAMKKFASFRTGIQPHYSSHNQIVFYFCGVVNKSNRRKRTIDFLSKVLVKNSDWGFVVKSGISYADNIKNVLDANCIVEALIDGQSGITIRTLESLCFERKLLTDNQRILEYEFYNPANIFIIGKDDIDQLHNFLSTPYVKIDEEIIMRYDVNVRMSDIIMC